MTVTFGKGGEKGLVGSLLCAPAGPLQEAGAEGAGSCWFPSDRLAGSPDTPRPRQDFVLD